MKKDDTRVYLWVSDFGEDASVVTKTIGLEPTHIKVAGEPNPKYPKMINRGNSWELHSSLPSSAHIDEHIEALLRVLEPHATAVKAVSETFNVGISTAVYYYEDYTPGIHLTEHAISALASMGLSMDFDLYFLKDA